MPRRKEEFARIREQSKSHILQTALALFADHGVDGTSMAMIAKKAGISIGLAYNYFESKDDLMKELFSSAIENLNTALVIQAEKPTKNDCIRVMDNLAASAKQEKELWRLMVQIMLQPEVAQRLIAGLRTMPGNPSKVFREYFAGKRDPNAASKADALSAMVIGIVLFYVTHENETTMKKAFEILQERIL